MILLASDLITTVCMLSRRYEELNFRCLSSVRLYSHNVPEFLHDWPKLFVDHCVKRLLPSVRAIPSDNIVASGVGMYTVQFTVFNSSARKTVTFRTVTASIGVVIAYHASTCWRSCLNCISAHAQWWRQPSQSPSTLRFLTTWLPIANSAQTSLSGFGSKYSPTVLEMNLYPDSDLAYVSTGHLHVRNRCANHRLHSATTADWLAQSSFTQ